eukprot:scpid65156/ scgid4039/ 
MQNTRATRAGRVEISPSIAILLIILSCSLFAAFGMEDSLKRKCCKCFFAAFGILVYGFQVVILYWFLLPSLYIIKYFRMKKDPFDAEDPDTRARVYLYGFLLVVLDLIVVTIWIKLLAYDPWRCNQSRPTCVWLGWMCYSLHLASKLALIYIVVAEYTDAESEVGSNLLKTAVACTSVVYLCLTQVFFHDVGHQVSDGRAQSDQTPPPPRSVDRMTMGVVFDIIDNAELLDLLLRDGRRGHNPDTDKEELNTIKKGMTCVVTVVGTLALMLPAIALLSLEASQTPQPSSKEDAKPARRSSDEVPSAQNQLEPAQGDAERGQSPSDEERTAPDQLKSAQEEPKTRDKRLQVSSTSWKRLYLVASIIMNLIFFVLRVIIAFWHNNEVGIFIAKNIIFLIAYVLEFCETLEHKGGADSSDSASPSPTSVGDDVAQRTSTCTTGNLDESGADPRPQ